MSIDKTQITDFFGVDVRKEFEEYIAGVFTPWFHENYGADKHFAGFILDPAQTPDWRHPDNTVMLRFSTTNPGESLGLMANVRGKAQFSLREGLPSSEAKKQPWRIRSGDFPYAGFVFYRGLAIGGSGVKQESDASLCERIVDEGLIPIMSRAAESVMTIIELARGANIEVGDWKYLDGTPEQLRGIRHALAQTASQ